MTEPSSEALAQALEAHRYLDLAARARRDEFHDFQTPHAMPQHVLLAELRKRGNRAKPLIDRLIAGDFDATRAESDKWAASPDGQATLAELPADLRKHLAGP